MAPPDLAAVFPSNSTPVPGLDNTTADTNWDNTSNFNGNPTNGNGNNFSGNTNNGGGNVGGGATSARNLIAGNTYRELDITGGGADDNLIDISGSGTEEDGGLLDISGGANDDGGLLMPYETLINPTPVVSKALHFSWQKARVASTTSFTRTTSKSSSSVLRAKARSPLMIVWIRDVIFAMLSRARCASARSPTRRWRRSPRTAWPRA